MCWGMFQGISNVVDVEFGVDVPVAIDNSVVAVDGVWVACLVVWWVGLLCVGLRCD